MWPIPHPLPLLSDVISGSSPCCYLWIVGSQGVPHLNILINPLPWGCLCCGPGHLSVLLSGMLSPRYSIFYFLSSSGVSVSMSLNQWNFPWSHFIIEYSTFWHIFPILYLCSLQHLSLSDILHFSFFVSPSGI